MPESTLREQICELGRSIFERGLTSGSTDNISVRVDDGFQMNADRLSCRQFSFGNEVLALGSEGSYARGAVR